jgi:hypothetical protein
MALIYKTGYMQWWIEGVRIVGEKERLLKLWYNLRKQNEI